MAEMKLDFNGFNTQKITLGERWLFHLGDCPDAWRKDFHRKDGSR